MSHAGDAARRPALAKTSVRVYSDVLYHGFVVAATELESGWLARETIQRVDARELTAEDFSCRFEQRSCPVHGSKPVSKETQGLKMTFKPPIELEPSPEG